MSENAIEARNLCVRFQEYLAVEDLTLTVPGPSFVAIVGPNGAGKSTFLKMLLGLIYPTSGTLRIFGDPPQNTPPKTVGYVPQMKTMDRSFPALAIELVLTGLTRRWPWRLGHADRQKALSALERVGIADLALRSLSMLSSGELQRVYLARSLVRKPKLVILDEPATGIDAVGEADLYELLEEFQDETGATLLMVTHDWQVAYHHAGLVLLMNRKQIHFGPPAETLNEDNIQRAFGHTGHRHRFNPEENTSA